MHCGEQSLRSIGVSHRIKTDIGHKKASTQSQLFLTCLEGKTSHLRIMSPSDYAWFRNVFSKSHATPTDWNKLSLYTVSSVPEYIHMLYIYDIEAGVAFLQNASDN